jgi:hypothetical protein
LSMATDTSAENTPASTDLPLGRPRHRVRRWSPPARALLNFRDGQSGTTQAKVEPQDPTPQTKQESCRYFHIIDNRFGTPIHIFLELDPSSEPGFCGLKVNAVTLETAANPSGAGVPAGVAIGRNPHQLDQFRAFGSDRAVAGAGFILIEPRYVGPSWPSYVLAFRPGGEKPVKRSSSDHHSGNGRR